MFEGGLSDFQTLELVSCVLCFACFVYGAQRPVWCSASSLVLSVGCSLRLVLAVGGSLDCRGRVPEHTR
jgi:hypothetical protein